MKGKRRFYAEDVAWMFIMKTNGYNRRQISNRFFISPEQLDSILRRARKHGFDKFPKRKSK